MVYKGKVPLRQAVGPKHPFYWASATLSAMKPPVRKTRSAPAPEPSTPAPEAGGAATGPGGLAMSGVRGLTSRRA